MSTIYCIGAACFESIAVLLGGSNVPSIIK